MPPARSVPWKQGWLLSWLAVTAVWLAQAATGFLQPVELWWSDRVLASVPRKISSEVALVTIDDASLSKLGHWPWSRELHARMIDRLTEVEAKVVVHTVPFVGAEAEDALSQLHRIAATVAADPDLAEHPRLAGLLTQSQDLLDGDTRLARSLAQNQRTLLSVDPHLDGSGAVTWPLASLSASALGVGVATAASDDDGVLRRVALVQTVDGRRLPHLSAWAVAAARSAAPTSVVWRAGQSQAAVADRVIPVDRQGSARPLWRSPSGSGDNFTTVPAVDLIKGEGPDPRLAGKLVFVGLSTATGATLQALPDGGGLRPIDVVAQTASALLTGQLLRTPAWLPLAEAALVAMVAIFVVVFLPRMARWPGLASSGLITVVLLVVGYALLRHALLWFPVVLPVVALWVGSFAWWLVHGARERSPRSGAAPSVLSQDGPRSQASGPFTMSPALPRLGRFQIVRELGRGAMGRIYVAHELETLRPVALKTLALSREFKGVALDEARDRFRREATAASRLHHPDIVRLIDAGEDQGLVYIAMELLGGENLSRHTRKHDLLPVPVVLELGARLAEALHHAHRHGVIHRDIKPANVMVDFSQGMVKITDFGVARVIDAARTRTGIVLGSPSYMSPEQLIGRTVDGRSDLFSLGVLLFELLTGALPAQGATLGALIDAVVNHPAPDVRTLRPRLPEAVANIVALALEKRPELRYADCQQMAADLRAVATLWRQSTGAAAEALQGSWSSPSEFAESLDPDPAGRHVRLHAATQAIRPGVQALTADEH